MCGGATVRPGSEPPQVTVAILLPRRLRVQIVAHPGGERAQTPECSPVDHQPEVRWPGHEGNRDRARPQIHAYRLREAQRIRRRHSHLDVVQVRVGGVQTLGGGAIEGETANVDIEKMIVVGLPFVEILKIARDLDLPMIVMGIRGQSTPAEEILFGSTAEKVLRGTRVPVLCVPY